MLRHDLGGDAHLRLLEVGDAEELYALIDANRAHLARWMPWAAGQTLEDTRWFIRGTRRQLGDSDGMQTAIVADGAIGGVIGLHRVDWQHGTTSIGYWLAEDRQGRGLVTRAVAAYADHAFGVWSLGRMELRAAVENARSRAVAQRLGFREEGVLRHVERNDGRSVDHVVHSLLADEWRAR